MGFRRCLALLCTRLCLGRSADSCVAPQPRGADCLGRRSRSGPVRRVACCRLLPRLPDYIRCFALMAIPAVATTMAIIFLRTATNGVQSSLYVVYLNGMGLTGTSIGVLFAAIEITSGLGSLFPRKPMRPPDPQPTILTRPALST